MYSKSEPHRFLHYLRLQSSSRHLGMDPLPISRDYSNVSFPRIISHPSGPDSKPQRFVSTSHTVVESSISSTWFQVNTVISICWNSLSFMLFQVSRGTQRS